MEQETATTATTEHATGGHGHGAIYEDPAFFVALGFVIFIAIAAKFIWPIIGRGLDDRSNKIREQLEQAARLRAEAEALLKQYEAQQKEMLKEAEQIVENAKKDAKTIRDTAAKDLKASLERRAAQAEENIARAEQQAIADMRTHLIDVATEATRGVVAKQLEGQKDDPAITRALAAIERQIH
jgi:F-type H+-transporting ATPase subunit b